MAKPELSILARISLAFGVFWRIVTDTHFASEVAGLKRRDQAAADAAGSLRQAEPDSALQLLGLLQQDGRFVDFLREDVAVSSDAQVGAAVRVVHEGCRKALEEHLTVVPVRPEQEGSRVTLEEGFDASAVRLTGNVVGQAPFSGTLTHRGWQVTEIHLPKIATGHDLRILAPAEVEL